MLEVQHNGFLIRHCVLWLCDELQACSRMSRWKAGGPGKKGRRQSLTHRRTRCN